MSAEVPHWQRHTLSPPQSRAILLYSVSGPSEKTPTAHFHPRTKHDQDKLVMTQQLPEFADIEEA